MYINCAFSHVRCQIVLCFAIPTQLCSVLFVYPCVVSSCLCFRVQSCLSLVPDPPVRAPRGSCPAPLCVPRTDSLLSTSACPLTTSCLPLTHLKPGTNFACPRPLFGFLYCPDCSRMNFACLCNKEHYCILWSAPGFPTPFLTTSALSSWISKVMKTGGGETTPYLFKPATPPRTMTLVSGEATFVRLCAKIIAAGKLCSLSLN
ncbi:hypothetical protein AAFF_G00282510 [Aldrovandia affinis]|uniref:Uncharacterized protein n=1 Tax=Aldrovandia affinis TaxID=143900 RepID=A0AAD7T9T8_9TELE|nr:hypothetical protein AAFF_G00282510 [Aldrovandia affinis]